MKPYTTEKVVNDALQEVIIPKPDDISYRDLSHFTVSENGSEDGTLQTLLTFLFSNRGHILVLSLSEYFDFLHEETSSTAFHRSNEHHAH